MEQLIGRQKCHGTDTRNRVLDFLDASLRWDDDDNAVFDLHLNFGKVSFDKHNRVVDRANFRV